MNDQAQSLALGRGLISGAHRWIERRIIFARHVPAQRILRRIVLTLRRRWLQRFHEAELPVPSDLNVATASPVPLMPPRGGLEVGHDGTEVTLLEKTKVLRWPILWRDPGHERGGQLWWMTLNYMEYVEAADDDTFARLVGSWIDSVRPYGPGYWRDLFNSYVISIRAVVWMQQLARRSSLPTKLRHRMTSSIAGQLYFLERNLETDIGGNHLIKNIKALLWGSVFFSGNCAQRWRQKGLNLLARELSHQILDDGVHFERSPSYHHQVFVDLLEIRYALGGDPLGGQLDQSLAAMAQVVADLSHPDGQVAQFNDSGLSMSYSSTECLEAFKRIFGFKPCKRNVFNYPAAGYFGWASTHSHFIADCGAIGPDDLPGHSHGDVLSFEWSVNGRRLIVDQGVYEYVAGARRATARSARSHNTLSIAGLDQADFFADFRVGRRPRVKVVQMSADSERLFLEGFHDGYAPLIHARVFEVSSKELKISDRLKGGFAAGVVVGLLLHPDAVATVSGADIHVILGSTTVCVRGTVPFAIEPATWWPNMGSEIPTQRILARWPSGCEAATLTLSMVDGI